jgi:RsiW-degrading membrane proteinase PrsW (M82 family)
MINPVQPLAVCSLLLLSLPSISAELDDMKIMSKMGWPAVAASAAIGNHTDPDNDQSHHANEMAANILGYTLVGIMVLMFFFAVVTFGRSCCIQCKNVSFWVLLFLCCVQSCFSASTLSSFLIIHSSTFLSNLHSAALYSHDTAARDVADICEVDGQKAEMPLLAF